VDNVFERKSREGKKEHLSSSLRIDKKGTQIKQQQQGSDQYGIQHKERPGIETAQREDSRSNPNVEKEENYLRLKNEA